MPALSKAASRIQIFACIKKILLSHRIRAKTLLSISLKFLRSLHPFQFSHEVQAMARTSWLKISSKWKQEYLAPFLCISAFKNTLQILTCQDIKEPFFQQKEAKREDAEVGSKMDGWYFNFVSFGFISIVVMHQNTFCSTTTTKKHYTTEYWEILVDLV